MVFVKRMRYNIDKIRNNLNCTGTGTKLHPQHQQTQPLAAANSTLGSGKLNPRQKQSKPPAAANSTLGSSKLIDSAVQCRLRPTNTATLDEFLKYPFKKTT